VAYIYNIYKKESKRDLKNYREISVTTTMNRLYERILDSLIEKEYSSLEKDEQRDSELEDLI
jgi:hypothetical protein